MTAVLLALSMMALDPAHRDLTYKSAGGIDLKLDLYLPDKTNAPLVVWVHGGGWQQGSKSNAPGVEFLLARGFAYASIQYRLSHQGKWPAQLEDCESAIAWLRMNAKTYGYNANKVGAWGASAGGHLVAMLGTKSKAPGRADVVVNYYGPTDFLRMNDRPGNIDHDAPTSPESKLLGAPIREVPDLVKSASPLAFVTSKSSPMRIVHGDKDPLVLIEQSHLLRDALMRAGVRHEFETIVGGGHGGVGFMTTEMLEKVALWFNQLR